MVRLEKINGKNVWDALRLSVKENQREFVAGNDVSIIEAYTTITANGYAFPFGIYDDEQIVGFLMIGFDKDDYWDDAPDIANGNYNSKESSIPVAGSKRMAVNYSKRH